MRAVAVRRRRRKTGLRKPTRANGAGGRAEASGEGGGAILLLVRFDPEYVSQVLNENFEDAKTLFLSPLLAIHYAHLVMLADRGIIARRTS